MKDEIAIFLRIMFFVALIGVPIGLVITVGVHQDQTVIAEGTVVDIEMRESGHFLEGNKYYLQLNTSIKWYEIDEANYYAIDIGDYIVIYASNRIEIKGF